jgi:putative DNA primase/helicase
MATTTVKNITAQSILKDKYSLEAENEKTAQFILNKLELLQKIQIGDYYSENKDGKLTFFYPQILANKILVGKHVLNITGSEKDTLLYKNGVYIDTQDLRNEINKYLHYEDPKPEKNRVDTLKEIREIGFKNSNKVNLDENLINFKNGMYNIKEKKMVEHSPKYYSTIQVNYNYTQDLHKKKDINNTLFGHLINKSLDEDTTKILQEICGYCLCSSMEAQKFFIFVGKASNGKSQILKILNSFFNSKFVSSLELKHFQDDVRVFSLYNKRLNICADISAEYIEDDSLLKRATGEDEIHCNPKYRDGFDFYNQSKLLFSCNELPNIADKTMGFMRRLIIIPFDKVIGPEDKIPSIGKLIVENSNTMELIVSWAMEGLHRLIDNNWEFTETGRVKEAKKDFELENNSVKKFINDYCLIDDDQQSKNFIICNEFNKMYDLYCKEEGIKCLSAKKKSISFNTLNIDKKKNTLYHGWYYKGIAFKFEIKDLNKFEQINSSLVDENLKQIENPI